MTSPTVDSLPPTLTDALPGVPAPVTPSEGSPGDALSAVSSPALRQRLALALSYLLAVVLSLTIVVGTVWLYSLIQ